MNSRSVPVHVLLSLCWLASGFSDVFAGELPWLRSHGTQIVDERGTPVLLRGVNLGGWLVEEMWMMPFQTVPPAASGFPEITDHVTLWKVIGQRFGAAKVRSIRSALRDAWLDEDDLERIRRADLNVVRVPFLYDLVDEPDGFTIEQYEVDRDHWTRGFVRL